MSSYTIQFIMYTKTHNKQEKTLGIDPVSQSVLANYNAQQLLAVVLQLHGIENTGQPLGTTYISPCSSSYYTNTEKLNAFRIRQQQRIERQVLILGIV